MNPKVKATRTKNTKIKMTVLQWNSNGIKSHIPELEILTTKINPSVICIQETRLHTHQDFKFKKYNVFRKDRLNPLNASGGVAILTANHVPANEIHLNTDLEATAVSVILPGIQKITICCIYLPPNQIIYLPRVKSSNNTTSSSIPYCGRL